MEKSALRSVAGTSRAGVGRREAGQALRRSAKNSLRDRLADHAAILDGRKHAAQSPFHRTGAKLHGAHGPAPRPARGEVGDWLLFSLVKVACPRLRSSNLTAQVRTPHKSATQKTSMSPFFPGEIMLGANESPLKGQTERQGRNGTQRR